MCRVNRTSLVSLKIVIPTFGGKRVNSKDRPNRISHLSPRDHLRTITAIAKSRGEERVSSQERNQRVTRPCHTYRGYTPAIRYSPCMCIRGQAGRGGTLQELTVNSWSRDTRPARSGFPNLGWTSRRRFEGNERSVFARLEASFVVSCMSE